MNHTRGPWATDEQDHCDPYQHIRVLGGNRAIAELWIDDAPVPEYNAEQWANARLIAAAPELLEALQRLEQYGHTQATWEFALRAIAKAAGK